MNQSDTSIYIEAFEKYKSMGLDPLPIPYEDGHPAKGPKTTGWNITAAAGGYTEKDFAEPCNIGVLLGGEKNLTDIDLDSPEAVLVGGEIMDDLAKTTGKTMMFGRPSKRRSHYICRSDKSLPSEKITDPIDHECVIEYRCVNEDGSRGRQTVFPPSLRYDLETGEIEDVRFEDDSAQVPVVVDADKLYRRFRMIGAIALLAKHFPVKSERHDTILALAGCFARAGMEEQKAVPMIGTAYRHSKGYHNDGGKAETVIDHLKSSFSELSPA